MSRTNRDRFLETLSEQIGYTSGPNRDSTYGRATGHPNQYWGGALLDVVAREAGVQLPAMTYPPAALQEFARTGRLRRAPRTGDIAFFAFSQDPGYSVSHIGVVLEVQPLFITTIEGQVSTGLPKGRQDADGVYRRTRYTADVAIFARPVYGDLPEGHGENLGPDLHTVRPSHFTAKPTATTVRSVELVQLALGQVTGLRNAKRGSWSAYSRSAYAQWQRQIGYVGAEANGEPDLPSLERLAHETGLFEVLP